MSNTLCKLPLGQRTIPSLGFGFAIALLHDKPACAILWSYHSYWPLEHLASGMSRYYPTDLRRLNSSCFNAIDAESVSEGGGLGVSDCLRFNGYGRRHYEASKREEK